MSFPEIKTTFWRGKRPIGWEELGETENYGKLIDGKIIATFPLHDVCYTRLNIGKENDVLFRYCPKCMVKVSTSV